MPASVAITTPLLHRAMGHDLCLESLTARSLRPEAPRSGLERRSGTGFDAIPGASFEALANAGRASGEVRVDLDAMRCNSLSISTTTNFLLLKNRIRASLEFCCPSARGAAPLSETTAEPDSKAKRVKLDHSRRRRLEARQAKAARNIKLFNLLKAGVPIAEIALQEGLSVRRAREVVQEILARREVDPPAGFVQLQIGRLSDAMMVAHAAMMEGNMHALDRVLRIVGQLDRYHGLARPPADSDGVATPTLAAVAPTLALPAPAETAEKRHAGD